MSARALVTSVAAKIAIAPVARTQRSRVFLYLVNTGVFGATDQEIESALSMPGNTVRPRRLELEKRGLVVDSKRCRSTIAGRWAAVWVVPHHVLAGVERRQRRLAGGAA